MFSPDSAITGISGVVGVGAATLDSLWTVSSFSGAETVQMAGTHKVMGGGPVATALCVLACLGHRATLVDVCGDDAVGDQIIEELKQFGVSTASIQRCSGANSAQAVVIVRCGDAARQIIFHPSSAGEPVLDEETKGGIRSARLLHINGRHESVARLAVQEARRTGVIISFDGGAGRYRESIRDLLDASHVRIVSQEFACQWSGKSEMDDMLECLIQPPALVAVITNGMNGSDVVCANGTKHHQPAFKASPLVDSTGCGDVYHGGFLHGWLSGWDLSRCAEFASRLAARNAEGLGGRYVCLSGIPLLAC